MQSEMCRLIGEALLRDKKNARPRLVKEYRTEEERVSWEMFLGAIVFLILGVSILVNTITGFGKAAWFWNVLSKRRRKTYGDAKRKIFRSVNATGEKGYKTTHYKRISDGQGTVSVECIGVSFGFPNHRFLRIGEVLG